MRFSIRTIWCVGFILSEMLGDWHINNLAEREEQRMKPPKFCAKYLAGP
jgi:hypothetical protein